MKLIIHIMIITIIDTRPPGFQKQVPRDSWGWVPKGGTSRPAHLKDSAGHPLHLDQLQNKINKVALQMPLTSSPNPLTSKERAKLYARYDQNTPHRRAAVLPLGGGRATKKKKYIYIYIYIYIYLNDYHCYYHM